MDEQPSLGQLIWLVRRELEWAQQVDADRPLRFEVEKVEMDVGVEITRATTGNGGLDLKVLGVGVSVGGSLASTTGSTSTVHLVLAPRDVRSGDHRLTVSGLDTEPPPRRAELPVQRVGADGQRETAAASSPSGGADTEPPPADR